MRHYSPAIRRICVFVFCLTLALTLGQGITRFRHVLGATGQQFINLNEADALVHVTLAQRLLNGQGFTLPTTPADGPIGDSQPAYEKAPGYPFFLAVLFRITGFGFSFFPLQCLFAGLLSVLVVLISAETFGQQPLAALFAGVGAAVHPVLVNAASQVYNEDLYFFLFFLCVWLYMRWYRNPSLGLALLCGCCAGVTALVRESILAPFACLILLALVSGWRVNRMAALKNAVALGAGLLVVVLPWSIRNYVVARGEIVPISTISLYLFGAGNNDCVAVEGWDEPFFGDNPCRILDQQKSELLASEHQVSQTITRSRASSTLATRWILGHIGGYVKLCVRRAWTVFDPWHRWQHVTGFKKLYMLLYFLIFVATGVCGIAWLSIRGLWTFEAVTLAVLLLAMYAPLVLVFVSHDHRFAVGIHVILACFGGAWLAHFPLVRESRFLKLGKNEV